MYCNVEQASPIHMSMGTPFATCAEKLRVPRKIRVSGQVEGEGTFDGSSDMEIKTKVLTITNQELEEMFK